MSVDEILTPNFRIVVFKTAQFGEKCYLAQDLGTRRMIMVDPGDAYEPIEKTIIEMGGALDYILLTHGHIDHLFSADRFSERFSLPCLMHAGDAKLARRAELFSIRYSKRLARPPKRITFIEAPSVLRWGNVSIQVLPCPGHTPGGVSFWLDEFVFTGDTLFFEKLGSTNYPESSLEALKESAFEMLRSVPEKNLILPGHGRSWQIGQARNWWILHAKNLPQFSIVGSA